MKRMIISPNHNQISTKVGQRLTRPVSGSQKSIRNSQHQDLNAPFTHHSPRQVAATLNYLSNAAKLAQVMSRNHLSNNRANT
jgi:hypothetical protein